MKKNLDILLALAAFVCLVKAYSSSHAKPQQAHNSASDPTYTTGHGGGYRGSPVGGGNLGGRPNEDPARGLGGPRLPGGVSGASGIGFGGSPNLMNAGGGSSGTHNSAGLGITVISCGSRPPGNSANSVRGQNEQEPSNRNGQVIPSAVGGSTGGDGSLGGGLVGSARAEGIQAGSVFGSGTGATTGNARQSMNTGNVSNHNRRSNEAINSGTGTGSSSISSGLNSSNGEGGGRADASAGRAGGVRGNRSFGPPGLDNGSNASGASTTSPEEGQASRRSRNGLLGTSDGFSGIFGTRSIGFTPDGELIGLRRGSIIGGRRGAGGGGVRGAGTVPGGSISAGRRGSDGSSAPSSAAGRVGGGADSGVRGPAGQGRNVLSGRPTFGSGSSVGLGSNGTPESGMSLAGSLSGSSGFGDGFPDGLGESSPAENSNRALGIPGGHAAGSADSAVGSLVTGGVSVSRGRGSSVEGPAGAAGASGGGTSVTSGSQVGRAVQGLGSPVAAAGGGADGRERGVGGISGVPHTRSRQQINGGLGIPAGSNRRTENGLPPRAPSGDSLDARDASSAGLVAGSSGRNSNGDIAGAGESISGPGSPDNSQLGRLGAGSRTSVGTGGELGTNGRGGSGRGAVLPASQTEFGSGKLPESETGLDGTNDGHTEQNTTASGTPNTDESSLLSIPLGNGPLGLNLPRLFHRRRGPPSHDAAVAAAVALGAIAGVAAAGALGAGIAAAVHANRRHNRHRPGGLRSAGSRRGITKPGISRVGRERRSIAESKVPAEIFQQIPMNFERLY